MSFQRYKNQGSYLGMWCAWAHKFAIRLLKTAPFTKGVIMLNSYINEFSNYPRVRLGPRHAWSRGNGDSSFSMRRVLFYANASTLKHRSLYKQIVFAEIQLEFIARVSRNERGLIRYR